MGCPAWIQTNRYGQIHLGRSILALDQKIQAALQGKQAKEEAKVKEDEARKAESERARKRTAVSKPPFSILRLRR